MLGAPHQLVVTTPAFFEDINATHFESFDKGDTYATIMRDVLGFGIFAVDGSSWRDQRKLVSRLFSQRALRETLMTSVHASLTELHAVLDAAAAGADAFHDLQRRSVDLTQLFFRFSTETFVDFALGVRMSILQDAVAHPFHAALDTAERILLYRFFHPQWLWRALRSLNVGYERDLKHCVRVIDDTIYDMLEQALEKRRCAPSNNEPQQPVKRDIVSLFLDSASSNNESFDAVALRDLVVNIVVAGRDSTAITLSWFFSLLSNHPDVEAKIREELQAIRGRGDSNNNVTTTTLTYEQSQQLAYLDAALRETTRLYPATPMNIKQANKDVVLHDGTFVGEGWRVVTSSYAIARMPSVWGDDASAFKSERWLDPVTGGVRRVPPFEFTAFHSGSRACLGMSMAFVEMRIVVASLLSRYRITCAPQKEPATYAFALLLQMRDPLIATLERVDVNDNNSVM